MQSHPFRLRTVMKALVLGSILLLFVGYVIYQSRLLLTGPVITLRDEPASVQTERTIVLQGTAENITNITLNGRPIVTTENGRFAERVILENGYTTVRIAAEDRYGRATNVDRVFVYTPGEN